MAMSGQQSHRMSKRSEAGSGAKTFRDARRNWPVTLRIPCRGAQIHATPSLTGGPTIARAFRDLLRHVGPESTGTPNKSFYLSAALGLRNAFAHRLKHMGDSAEASAASDDAACTSHFSIVDKDGMAVAVTQTLLSAFGSAVTSRQTGVLLNNGLYWFGPAAANAELPRPRKALPLQHVPARDRGRGRFDHCNRRLRRPPDHCRRAAGRLVPDRKRNEPRGCASTTHA